MTAHNPFVENKIRELIELAKADPNLTVEECAAKAEEIRGTADRVVPRLTNGEMIKINYAMRLFQLKHNSLDPVEEDGRLFPGVKPSFRIIAAVLPRPLIRRDWDFCHLLSAHISRPWHVTGAVHSFDGEKWDEFEFDFKCELKFRYVEQLVDSVIAEIKSGLNHKFIRHTTWTAKVWHHKEDGTPTRNKRKSKRRKSK